MPRNPSITLPAAQGMDNTDDPLVTPLMVGQQVTNLAADRVGVLRGTPKLVPLLNLAAVADGIAYYYGQSTFSGTDVFGRSVISKQPDAAGDRVLYISATALYSSAYANLNSGVVYGSPYSPQYLPQLQAGQAVTTQTPTFTTGQPLRSSQFATELILVQKGATSNYRYYIDANTTSVSVPAGKCYTQGLETPVAPTLAYGTPSGGYVAKVGTIYYVVCLIDEFGRYSSPSATVTGDFVTNPTKDAALTFTVTAGMATRFAKEGVAQIAFLGTIQGAPGVYYLLQEPITGNPAIRTYTGAGTYTWEDGVPDTTVATGLLGPSIGQNDAPDASSICIVWKNRMVQNDLYNPNILQISNDGSPTQFNTTAYDPELPVPTNGLRMTVDQDNGNPIMALVSFGTVLSIFKQRSIFLLYGEDASNFVIQPVYYGHGCVAEGSAVRCEGVVLYLSDDGVYSWSGGEPTKISKPIESFLYSYALTQAGAAAYAKATATFNDRQYMLYIGQDCYVYNLDNEGWTMRAFGPDANSFIATTTPASISPFDPISFTPNPTLAPFVPDPSIGQPGAGPNTPPSGAPGGPSGIPDWNPGPSPNPVQPPDV